MEEADHGLEAVRLRAASTNPSHDPHAPEHFGSTITFDLPVGQMDNPSISDIEEPLEPAGQELATA